MTKLLVFVFSEKPMMSLFLYLNGLGVLPGYYTTRVIKKKLLEQEIIFIKPIIYLHL